MAMLNPKERGGPSHPNRAPAVVLYLIKSSAARALEAAAGLFLKPTSTTPAIPSSSKNDK